MNTILLVAVVVVGLYIAFKLATRRKSTFGLPTQSDPVPTEKSGLPVLAVERVEEFTEIALQDSAGNNVVRMLRVPASSEVASDQQFRSLDIKSTGVSRLAPILGALPGLAQSAAVHGKDIMQVIVNGSLHPGKIADTLSPVVRNTKGRITEWAVLKDPKALQNAAKLAAVFQIASVVVAQQHLADISQKLKAIEQGINGIKNFLETQRSAIITGSLTYLRQAYSAISAGELSPLFRKQLETLELDLLRVQEHLFEEIKAMREKTCEIQNPDNFGTEGFSDAIKAHQVQIDKSLNAWLLCIRTRIANWQVLSGYPGEINIKLVRKESIAHAIEKMLAEGGICTQLSKEMNAKIAEIKAFWNTSETLDLRKSDLRNNFDAISREFTTQGRQIQTDLAATTQSLLSYENNPLTLNLIFENGKIVEAFEMIQDSKSKPTLGSHREASFSPDATVLKDETSSKNQAKTLHPDAAWPFSIARKSDE